MNFQTKYTTGKNKNIKEALKMISVHEWIWIGFVPFCFLAIGINSLLAPIDDSYVQIAILLFAASLVLFGLSFSKILKTNLGLMKRLDEMGPARHRNRIHNKQKRNNCRKSIWRKKRGKPLRNGFFPLLFRKYAMDRFVQ